MLDGQRKPLKSPWSSPKAQGILSLLLGVTFIAQGLSSGTFTWLRWLQLAGGATFLAVGIYTLATAARSR